MDFSVLMDMEFANGTGFRGGGPFTIKQVVINISCMARHRDYIQTRFLNENSEFWKHLIVGRAEHKLRNNGDAIWQIDMRSARSHSARRLAGSFLTWKGDDAAPFDNALKILPIAVAVPFGRRAMRSRLLIPSLWVLRITA